MVKPLISLVLIIFFSPLLGENCYSEYWQSLYWKMWENDSFALKTYVKLETKNHLKSIRSIQFNEQLLWKASKNLSLEIHYTYLHSQSIVSNSKWRWHHRLELEANPLFPLPCHRLIKTRNRLEIIREKDEPKTLYRLRQRTMLVIPLQNHVLKAFSISNELFYDISTHLFNQDRICPFQLTFALSEKVDLDVFFLIRLFITDAIWRKSYVIGTQLNF